jgi:hypothetical protein
MPTKNTGTRNMREFHEIDHGIDGYSEFFCPEEIAFFTASYAPIRDQDNWNIYFTLKSGAKIGPVLVKEKGYAFIRKVINVKKETCKHGHGKALAK